MTTSAKATKLSTFIEAVSGKKYKTGQAARQAISRLALSPAEKVKANKAVDTTFGPSPSKKPAAKKPAAKKPAAKKLATKKAAAFAKRKPTAKKVSVAAAKKKAA
jgi:hypothetical protein